MKDSLRPGLRHAHRFTVTAAKTVPALYPESALFQAMPQVFADNRDSMVASMENLVRVARSDEAKSFYTDSLPVIYREMGATLRETHPNLTEEQAEASAQLYFVLAQGLGVLWVIAPDGLRPDGDRLAEALTAITAESPGATA